MVRALRGASKTVQPFSSCSMVARPIPMVLTAGSTRFMSSSSTSTTTSTASSSTVSVSISSVGVASDKPLPIWRREMPDSQFQTMRNILAAPSPVGLEAAMTRGMYSSSCHHHNE
jgi:hypothetical protein